MHVIRHPPGSSVSWLTSRLGTGDERTVPPMNETWQVVTSLPTPLTAGNAQWTVIVEGSERADGTWAGRLLFVSGTAQKRTGQETSQPNREALEYWATGLELVYLEGAFTRAS